MKGYHIDLVVVPLVGLLLLGVVLAAAHSTRGPKLTPQPTDTVILEPPKGYRRADSREVTASMRDTAIADLKNPLGSIEFHTDPLRGDYAIGIESHYDQARGWHKGASVFVPSGDLV